MDLGIKGRRAIVTGGGSGIGFKRHDNFSKRVCAFLLQAEPPRRSTKRATNWQSEPVAKFTPCKRT